MSASDSAHPVPTNRHLERLLQRALPALARAHRRAIKLARKLKRPLPSLATRMATCGALLSIRLCMVTGLLEFARDGRCGGGRTCPLCAKIDGLVQTSRYVRLIQVVRREHPGCEVSFVTLTIENVEDLAAGINSIRRAAKRLRRRGDRARKKGQFDNEMANVLGGVNVFECPRGSDRLWNVHLHGLWISLRPLTESGIRSAWQDVGGGSHVRVKSVRGLRTATEDLDDVTGYLLKGEHPTAKDRLEIRSTLKGRHLHAPFGLLNGALGDLQPSGPFALLDCTFRGDFGYAVEIREESNDSDQDGGAPR